MMMDNNWKNQLTDKLNYLGHRNWILVVDKAYPLQNSEGISVFNSGEPLPEALGFVLGKVTESTHVRPIVYLDKELKALNETYCPGIEALRNEIMNKIELAHPYAVHEMIHEDIISKIDERSKLFSIVVVKTEALLPYTSVFIELDCGYWQPDQEKKLRDSMK